jgi:hypothetical protein
MLFQRSNGLWTDNVADYMMPIQDGLVPVESDFTFQSDVELGAKIFQKNSFTLYGGMKAALQFYKVNLVPFSDMDYVQSYAFVFLGPALTSMFDFGEEVIGVKLNYMTRKQSINNDLTNGFFEASFFVGYRLRTNSMKRTISAIN